MGKGIGTPVISAFSCKDSIKSGEDKLKKYEATIHDEISQRCFIGTSVCATDIYSSSLFM